MTKVRKYLQFHHHGYASNPFVGVRSPFDQCREGFNNKKIMSLMRHVATFALEFQQKCETEY